MYEIRKKGYSPSVHEALGSVPSTAWKTLEQHYYEEDINHGEMFEDPWKAWLVVRSADHKARR